MSLVTGTSDEASDSVYWVVESVVDSVVLTTSDSLVGRI